jgi:hypothetical protein
VADRVREAIPNALDVHLEYEREAFAGVGAGSVASLGPRDQFLAYFKAQHGGAPDPGLLSAFDEVLEAETEGA